ncbi:hypothetical protein HGA88_05000, partial [Candidatus Roizmanbacteria bacterium]|nr:hypothetical protein [Candidatus Roizmanbacteria bacterium]
MRTNIVLLVLFSLLLFFSFVPSSYAQMCSGGGPLTNISYACSCDPYGGCQCLGSESSGGNSSCSYSVGFGYCRRYDTASLGGCYIDAQGGCNNDSSMSGSTVTDSGCGLVYPTNTPTPRPTATPVPTSTPVPTTPPNQPTNTPAPTAVTCQSPGQYCDTWTSPSSPFCVQVTHPYNASTNSCSETYTPGGSCCGAVATPTTPPTLGGSCGAACTLSNQCSGDASWCNGGHCDGSACHGGPVSRGLRCDQFYAVSWNGYCPDGNCWNCYRGCGDERLTGAQYLDTLNSMYSGQSVSAISYSDYLNGTPIPSIALSTNLYWTMRNNGVITNCPYAQTSTWYSAIPESTFNQNVSNNLSPLTGKTQIGQVRDDMLAWDPRGNQIINAVPLTGLYYDPGQYYFSAPLNMGIQNFILQGSNNAPSCSDVPDLDSNPCIIKLVMATPTPTP